jgi:tetratricopeptide (TPR) repeat protein
MLIAPKTLLRWFTVFATALILIGCGGAQSRYASHMKRAQEYYSEDNFVKASVEYRNAMRISPKDPTAIVMAAKCAEKLGRIREAGSLYQGVVDSNPTNLSARAGLARLMLLGGVLEQAQKLIEIGLNQAPDNVELLTLRAATRNQLKDVAGATSDVDHALKLAPHDEDAVAVRTGLYKQAGDLQKAIELVSAAVSANPKSSNLRMILTDLLIAAGEPDKAEKEARALVQLKPQELSRRTQLARLLVLDKKPDEAQRVLEEAVKTFPDQDDAKLVLVDFVSNRRSPAEGEKILRGFIARDPKDDDLRLRLAAMLQRSGAQAEAKTVYNDIIKRNDLEPKGLEARDRLAALAMQNHQYDDAGKLVQEVLNKNPQDNDALMLRASLSMDKADAVTAIGALRGVLRDQPGNLVARRTLARAYTANGEPALAEETLRAAVQMAPTDTSIRLELAQLLTNTKRADGAVAILEPAVRDAPTDPTLRAGLIQAYLAKKDFAAARGAAEDLKVLQPKSAVGYYYAGLAAEADNRPQDDEKELEQALQLQPDAFDVLSELAKLRMSRGRIDQAIALVKSAAERQAANAELQNLLGQIYLAQKNLPLAEQTLKHASELSPKWWVPYRNLALVRLAAKDTDGAISAYKASIQANPNQVQSVTELAQLYEAQNQIDEAIAVYESHQTRDAHASQVANNLAMLLVTYKQDHPSLDRARDLTAAFASASDANLLDTYGWVRFKRAEYAVAVPALERAVQRAPDSRQIRYHLGMAELRSGQSGRARTDLEAALAGGAKFPGAADAKMTLASLGGQSG